MRKLIISLIVLSFLMMGVNAEPVLNNSGLNIVTSLLNGNTYNDTDTNFLDYPSNGLYPYNIQIDRTILVYDFTTYKSIDSLTIPMKLNSNRLYNGGTGCSGQVDQRDNYASLPIDGYGNVISERLTQGYYYVDGVYYGTGLFGFTSNSNPAYFIKINVFNNSLVNTLTGFHNVTISYDHAVFDGVTWEDFYNNGNGGNFEECQGFNFYWDTYTSPAMYGYVNTTLSGLTTYGYTQSDVTDQSTFSVSTIWSNYWQYWKNVSAGTQWLNVYRNGSDTQIVIIRNGSIIYNQRNTTNLLNYFFADTNALNASFKNMGNSLWYNYTLEGAAGGGGGGGDQPTPTGNISIEKSSYNRSEIMPIYYNISSAGRIALRSATLEVLLSVNNGSDQVYNYFIPSDMPFDHYVAYLQYYNGAAWVTLNFTQNIEITQIGLNAIEFTLPGKTYYTGNEISITAIGNETGFVKLLDTGGSTKFNFSISGNVSTAFKYFILTSDPGGTWTANLYNSTGDITATDTGTVHYVAGTPQPTITTTGVPGVTVDYVNNATARKAKENSFLNNFYGVIEGLFMLAVLATMVFFLKKLRM